MLSPQTRKRLLKCLSAAALLVFLGTAFLVQDGFHDDRGKADIALVLGTKVERDGRPSPSLLSRLEKTVELYQAGYFPEIIASGGVGKEGFNEAVVMRDYFVAHGIPKERITVDDGGLTTYASALNSVRILRQRNLQSIFVISQYYHLPRARLALKRFGASTVYSAHADLIQALDLYSAPREFFGYIEYWFRHYEFDSGRERSNQ